MHRPITEIDKQSVHRICSGQVILDLATAVKELIENSIDAGATAIDIKFKDHGFTAIEVQDNGCGIDVADYERLALKHYTSKLSSFDDLERVSTFGFRGEALSSLCALCNLVVTTATAAQAPKGVRLEYNAEGQLISTTPVARSVGTTVSLSNMFHSLPVRQQEFKRNIKREYSKALSMIQAYGIIAKGVRIIASNQTSKSQSSVAIATHGNKTVRENIANVFGIKVLSQIIPFSIAIPSSSSSAEGAEDSTRPCIEGFISKPEWGVGRGSSDRQYFYVNGRPCILPKLAKAFNEIYRTYVSNQYPFVVADLQLPAGTYDVNVTPDKRTVFIHEDQRLLESLTVSLAKYLEGFRSTFDVKPFSASEEDEPPPTESYDVDTVYTSNESSNLPSPAASSSRSSDRSRIATETSARLYENLETFKHNVGRQYQPSLQWRTPSKRTANTMLNYVTKKPRTADVTYITGDDSQPDYDKEPEDEVDSYEVGPSTQDMEDVIMENESLETEQKDTSSLRESDEVEHIVDEDYNAATEYIQDDAMDVDYAVSSQKWNTEKERLLIDIDPAQVLNRFRHRSEAQSTATATRHSDYPNLSSISVETAGISNTDDNVGAINALSRIIRKEDFGRMKVIGQFNLGFILVVLDEQDVFIVDQHASDEKYNFETLQQTTRIQGQRLIQPQNPGLTAAEELVAIENIEVLRANGFEVEVKPENEPTKRLFVVSQPFSKNTLFDKKDFGELVYLLTERPGQMVRCSRTRAMFASRACRKSVMIGHSLTKKRMTEIVRHMGEIVQPWNCPHGRPTIRHLYRLPPSNKRNYMKNRITCIGSLFMNQT